jgi:hypothetical protein
MDSSTEKSESPQQVSGIPAKVLYSILCLIAYGFLWYYYHPAQVPISQSTALGQMASTSSSPLPHGNLLMQQLTSWGWLPVLFLITWLFWGKVLTESFGKIAE